MDEGVINNKELRKLKYSINYNAIGKAEKGNCRSRLNDSINKTKLPSTRKIYSDYLLSSNPSFVV